MSSGAWADETYYLFIPTNPAVSPVHSGTLSGDFICQQSATSDTKTIDDKSFTHYVLVTANTSLTASWTTQYAGKTTIDYDMKTTSATFTIYAYNTNASKYGVCKAEVEEGKTPTSFSAITDMSSFTGAAKGSFTVTTTKNKRVRIGNSSYSNVRFYQIVVTETGTELPKPSKGNYTLDFSGKRFAVKAQGSVSSIDGIDVVAKSDCKYNGTVPKLSNGSNSHTYYIKISTGTTTGMKLKVTTGSNKAFSLTNSVSEFAGTGTASGAVTELSANKDYYIQGNNEEITVSKIELIPLTVGETISASGWNTFSCDYPLDLSTITNGTAYVASAAEGSTVTLTPVTDKIVAKGTGLMVKGTTGDEFSIETTESAATFSGTNKLVGLPWGGTVDKNNHNYVFGWATAAPESPGFYLINDTEPVLGAGKSYLHADADLSARLFIDFSEGETTGIASVGKTQTTANNEFYNLAGQRVAQPTKGLYIVNGKKVIIK